MLGLDNQIAASSDGATLSIVLVVAILLGLRHATDPDHVAALTTLIAGSKERAARTAGKLGLAWGLGHALTLFAFGLPILLFNEYLPEQVQQVAETVIALVIVYLAARLIQRWRRGFFHVHEHEHDGGRHSHLHSHAEERGHAHANLPTRGRTPLAAFGIGLVHGMGGSAGVGVLLLASIESTMLAVACLVLLAAFTAFLMSMLSTGFGLTLVWRPVRAAFNGVAPGLGVASLVFGAWYAGAAWSLVPYPF